MRQIKKKCVNHQARRELKACLIEEIFRKIKDSMTNNKKSDNHDDPHVTITFLLPFECNRLTVNTRLHIPRALLFVCDSSIRFFIRVTRTLSRLKSFIRAFSDDRGQTDLEAAAAANAVTRYFQFGRAPRWLASRRVAPLERTKGPETVDWLFRLSCQSRDTA